MNATSISYAINTLDLTKVCMVSYVTNIGSQNRFFRFVIVGVVVDGKAIIEDVHNLERLYFSSHDFLIYVEVLVGFVMVDLNHNIANLRFVSIIVDSVVHLDYSQVSFV